MSPRAVLFDYGHTLIDFVRPDSALLEAYRRVNQRLERELEREVPAAHELLQSVSVAVDAMIEASYQRGSEQEVDISALYREALLAIGLELTAEMVDWVVAEEQRAWFAGVRKSPHAEPVLNALRTRGLRTAIVSNAAFPARAMREQMAHIGLSDLFDATVFSSELGLRKPNPAIYQVVLGKLEVDPIDAVFVGDRLREDIRGPRALGMDAILTHEFRQEDPEPGLRCHTIRSLAELPGKLS